MTDLFESPPQESEAARPAVGSSSSDESSCGGDRGPNGFTVAYFARKQAELRAAGEASAMAARMKARAAAQEGIDRAVAHAERDVPGWSDVAYEFIRLHAMQNRGKRFTGYEIVQAALAYGVPKPPTDKAFGGPLQRAARAQVLRKVGGVPDPNPERHGSMVPLWEAA